MKILVKEITMLSWTDLRGAITPIKFLIANKDESISTIIIDKVIKVEEEKLAGNRMRVFTCQSVIKGAERIFELKSEISSCKWILWKL
jgi:hypothetical protein